MGNLGAGGSVASSAWNLCCLLGAQNIYFAGLDLSYPQGQTHIKGSSAEQTFHTGANRLVPVQKMNSSSRFGANPEYAFDYDGNQVLTDARMKMFAWWFESKIAACTTVKTYTLSRSSMRIPGVEFAEDVSPSTGSGTTGTAEIAETAKIESDISPIIDSFYSELKSLSALINEAVEKCIIGGPELEATLTQIDSKISSSPLAEIVRLANPDTQDKLTAYKQLQKTLKLYCDS